MQSYSVSDSFSALGRTTLGITWELKIARMTENSCEFTNTVFINSTNEFLESLKAVNITDLSTIKSQMLQNVQQHNNEETPLFAADIYHKVLIGKWH